MLTVVLSSGCRLSSKPLLGFFNDAGSKLVSKGILNVDSLKATLMFLPVLNHTNTSPVSSTSHHNNISNIKLDEFNNLVALQVQLDSVVGLDEGIRITNGSAIIGINVWNSLFSKLHRADLAKLKLQNRNAAGS
nr:argonaute 12, putative [Ipomoea batatas]